jgi:DNA-binding MarR family transcriptional regulator
MTKIDVELIDGLFQLSFLLQSRLTRIAAENDLSLIQLRLMGILRDREPGMQELARHLELEKSSLSGLVDRAASRGLLERRPSTSDRRAATIRLTPEGRKLARRIEEAVGAEMAVLVRDLSNTERIRLAAATHRLLSREEQSREHPTSASADRASQKKRAAR